MLNKVNNNSNTSNNTLDSLTLDAIAPTLDVIKNNRTIAHISIYNIDVLIALLGYGYGLRARH